MKYLKRFESSTNIEEEILSYIKENYPEEWWNEKFSEGVYDYVTDDDLIGDGTEEEPDYEDAEDCYKNLCMGGAIEYDLLDLIGKDVSNHFNMSVDEYYKKDYHNIVNDYMIDTVDWYDSMVFSKSDEKYKPMVRRIDTSNWDDIK